jgi:histidinol-phosphate phosphatase family domain/HAD-superfamily hydrolase, subfamily IIIA
MIICTVRLGNKTMISYLFIDRDGVVNKDPGGWTKTNYVTDWKDFHFVPGTLEALKILKDKGIKVVVASNQGGVNKGLYTKEELSKVNARMLKEIEKAGGAVEEVFYCIHKDEDNCDCRKPKPGMLTMAAKKYGVDPKTTYFIGDAPKDIGAGKRIGCKTVLVLSGKSSLKDIEGWEDKPDYVFENLLEAVKFLTMLKGE